MKYFFIPVLFISVLISCNKTQNPFEIAKQHVGLLTDSTQVRDLKTVFANDSIVNFIAGDEFTGSTNDITIFNSAGEKLLIVTPEHVLDSTSAIGSIQIMHPLYKTSSGISTLSTFKDITQAHKISKIDNLINSVVVTVRELNAAFVIDKKELPPNLQFDMDLKFEPTHIPDAAKIKYFFLNWNH